MQLKSELKLLQNFQVPTGMNIINYNEGRNDFAVLKSGLS